MRSFGTCWSGLLCAGLLALAGCAADWSAGPAHGFDRGVTMTRGQAIEDIDFALNALADIHPDLYWRSDRAEIARRQKALTDGLPQNPTKFDLYILLSQLTALFNDGHVGVSAFPGKLGGPEARSILRGYFGTGGLFPAAFDPYADGLRVLSVPSGASVLTPGDVITRINDVSADELLHRLEAQCPGSTATKRYHARAELGDMLWQAGIRPPFRVDLVPAGRPGTRTVTLQGVKPAELADPLPRQSESWIRYRLLDGNIGLIEFAEMIEKPRRFEERLIDIFKRIASDKPRGLVIDIRRNAGGDSLLGDLLLRYITRKPYRAFAERHWKVSRTCQDWYGTFDGEQAEYFKSYRAKPAGQMLVNSVAERLPATAPYPHGGPVAVLMGPGTFSSAEIMADAISAYHLATLFGEPTSEPASLYGEVCEASLPHSGIRVAAPSAFFVRANGDEKSVEPVVPDIPVDEDPVRPESDPALDAARNWIRNQPPAP
jgi:Peptidase family S41